MVNRMLNQIRLCVVSGDPPERCLGLDHGGTGCTTGLYRLAGSVVTAVDRAVDYTIENSPEIQRDLDLGAYNEDLVRHVLAEAIRTGAAILDPALRPRTVQP